MTQYSYKKLIWTQFKQSKTGLIALYILALFFLIAVYAPLLASSKPLLVVWNGKLYSPLIRYLFYPGFYTKPIDLFYNILMFTFPVALLGAWFLPKRWKMLFLIGMAILQCLIFGFIVTGSLKDPASDPDLKEARRAALAAQKTFREDPLLAPLPAQQSWSFDLKHMSEYEKLNKLLKYKQIYAQHMRLAPYAAAYNEAAGRDAPTLFAVEKRHELKSKSELEKTVHVNKKRYFQDLDRLPELMNAYRPFSHNYIMAKYELEHASPELQKEAEKRYQQVLAESSETRTPLVQVRQLVDTYRKAAASLAYQNDKQKWFATESAHLHVIIPPFIRDFHWEEDAGGSQTFNSFLPWWELTRVNRKDLFSSLIFGIRISLVVGLSAIAIALLIGIPLGLVAGYFAGKSDLVICRLVEIWEAMPTFFMLLLVVAITQSKSIFLVIAVLGIFGWMGFARFIRAEVFKQRNLPYVMACKGVGYRETKIMFSHILPNAIPPILTLLPFTMMAAITSEAGISFLGLGEEGSTSWGVLMDEGRSVFPGESYLLWPPAILLTVLLVCIALVGDALRDAIDPKMRT